jgi:hypothetical protein
MKSQSDFSAKNQKFRRNFGVSSSKMQVDMAGVADNDQLVTGFQQMKPAQPNLCDEPFAPDLRRNPVPVSADHAAIGDRLGRKNLVKPDLCIAMPGLLHAAILAALG